MSKAENQLNPGKVFGIGLSKTGTTSLFAALHGMGYRAGTFRHFREIQFEEWFQGDFSRDYLKGFEALTDLPMGTFFPQLDQKYPGSKFILTTREVESWLASVQRQFTRKPEPESGFRRDVRMAAYGTSVFNEQRFRYVFEAHQRNVQWYFRNRPQDLLVMDLFAGDGWEKLGRFLAKDTPDIPFPNVKPGYRPEKMAPVENGRPLRNKTKIDPANESFAFVIPLRNPGDSKVNDYETVLTLLKQTIHSLLQQTHPNIHVIIVCHGAPAWAADFDQRVTFLDVTGCPVFKPDGLYKNLDKGLRWVIGTMYAKSRWDPALVMLLDADDYVHVQLASHLLHRVRNEPDETCDGFIVNEGVHSAIQVLNDYSIKYRTAFRVSEFDRSCGSCRIFKTTSLLQTLREIDPDIESRFQEWAAPDHLNSVPVSGKSVVWLFDETEGFHQSEQGVLGVIGRHGKQQTHFQLAKAGICGAAKSCGHGNHEGSRGGAVHWERVIRPMPLKDFYQDFGIPNSGSVGPDLSSFRGHLEILVRRFEKNNPLKNKPLNNN